MEAVGGSYRAKPLDGNHGGASPLILDPGQAEPAYDAAKNVSPVGEESAITSDVTTGAGGGWQSSSSS